VEGSRPRGRRNRGTTDSRGEWMLKQEWMEMSIEAGVGGKRRGLANPDSPGEWMLKQESVENGRD